MARDKAAKPVPRKHLGLTWLHRVIGKDERDVVPPGLSRLSAYSATVADGTLHVLRLEGTLPPGAPPAMKPPVAVRVTHVPAGGVALVEDSVTPPLATGGRAPLLAELDEVVHRFGSGRLMALMFDGGGLPADDQPAYWELVEIGGLIMAGGEPPPGGN